MTGAQEEIRSTENYGENTAADVDRLVVEPNVDPTSGMLLRRGLALAAMLALLAAGLMTNVFLNSR